MTLHTLPQADRRLTLRDLEGEVRDMLNSARVVRSFVESEIHHMISLNSLNSEDADKIAYLLYDAENRAELLSEKFYDALRDQAG